MEKITGTLIPDRDANCEKKCQRGIDSLETRDGARHEGSRLSIVEDVAGHELTIIVPMKWKSPGSSTDVDEAAVKDSTLRVDRREKDHSAVQSTAGC